MNDSFFDNSFGRSFDFGFTVVPILGTIIFIIVIAFFIVVFAKGISQWNKNNHSPRLTVDATIVAKRTNVSHSSGPHNHTTGMHTTGHTSTSYYVTFQVESGDRMEFHVSGEEYGLLVEGDYGDLSFQGTRYLGFTRK
ncbi:MAG: DUF2500 domain-containing protein [Lachnospiraceae bacterium]|nr:DUF2500 domain-containing protein [Lachnospiraceae bacterium]